MLVMFLEDDGVYYKICGHISFYAEWDLPKQEGFYGGVLGVSYGARMIKLMSVYDG